MGLDRSKPLGAGRIVTPTVPTIGTPRALLFTKETPNKVSIIPINTSKSPYTESSLVSDERGSF